MSAYRRNVFLGATVLVAVIVLVWMILQFGAHLATPFAPATIPVRFITDRADGIADGSPITFRGVDMGHVTKVWLMSDRPMVEFEGVINHDPPLPQNLVAKIRTASALGSGSMVALEVDGPPSPEALKADQIISAHYIGYGELLPMEQFGTLATELTAVAKQLHESSLIADLDKQVKNAGNTIDSIQQIVGDPQNRENIKSSIANLREVTEHAKTVVTRLDQLTDDVQKTSAHANEAIGKASDNIDSLARQMGDRLTQIAKLLDNIQSISAKIDKGEGTAGAMVNDPKLYQSLVDTSRELNGTVKDFKRLVEQWEQEGVTLKLK